MNIEKIRIKLDQEINDTDNRLLNFIANWLRIDFREDYTNNYDLDLLKSQFLTILAGYTWAVQDAFKELENISDNNSKC